MAKRVVKKRVAKNAKKKTQAKKKTKAKSKKAVKKPAAKKSGLSPLPPLKTCLKGKRIALAGRFSYPDKGPFEKFFKSCGGKIAKAIDGKLDILMVGEGRKPAAQTKAEKLNAKGDADILIIDQPTSAIPDFEFNLIEYLTSPDQFVPFSDIVKKGWLFHHSWRRIDGVDFSKKTIGPARPGKESTGFPIELDFDKCCFDRATIQNVDIGCHHGDSHECELNGTVFDNARFNQANQFTFNKCKGSLLELSFAEDCQLDAMVLDRFELRYSQRCNISNSKFKVFEDGWF